MNYQEWERQISALEDEALKKENSAAFARSMGHDKQASDLDKEASKLRQGCADMKLHPPAFTLRER